MSGNQFAGKVLKYKIAIVIISDRAASGIRKDSCLSVFRETIDNEMFDIIDTAVISDDPSEIEKTLTLLLSMDIDLIYTSGGTGCSLRDNTPEVTRKLIERPTPGIDEAIRNFSCTKSEFAIFSRAISGYIGKTLIINLPGSPKAVKEILYFLGPIIEHPLKLVRGNILDCLDEQFKP